LYKVVGRERVGRGRYSRYIVMFSTRWPEGLVAFILYLRLPHSILVGLSWHVSGIGVF
jgi:hypothetical protein